MAEAERRIGRYVVREHTAHRLVVEARGATVNIIAGVWIVFGVVAILLAPWLGGARLLVMAAAALIAAVVSLLVVLAIPRTERLAVDVEEGGFQAEYVHWIPQGLQKREIRLPLSTLEGIQCRRRVWRDKPNVEATRWAVELVEADQGIWRLAEGKDREPMQELAWLIAKVAGRPLIETE